MPSRAGTGGGAQQCLRFSAGLYNNGDGPLYLKFSDDIAYQHVYYSDSPPGEYKFNETNHDYLEVAAGDAEWHDGHKHRHFKDMVLYQLFSVSDDPVAPPYQQGKALTEVGVGNKHGYCTFSQRIERWSEFAQDKQFASFPSWEDACNKAMTLERGWGDLYRWQRPGQYVSYDGVADPDGTIGRASTWSASPSIRRTFSSKRKKVTTGPTHTSES